MSLSLQAVKASTQLTSSLNSAEFLFFFQSSFHNPVLFINKIESISDIYYCNSSTPQFGFQPLLKVLFHREGQPAFGRTSNTCPVETRPSQSRVPHLTELRIPPALPHCLWPPKASSLPILWFPILLSSFSSPACVMYPARHLAT